MGFLTIGAWDVDGQRFEIASRPKLDSRVVLPFFERDGELFAGVLERVRPSRGLRGAPLLGLEAIGFDFSGVDETTDLKSYGRAIFTARAGVTIDDAALAVALPSMARSIGYLTELTLPLLLGIRPPPATISRSRGTGATIASCSGRSRNGSGSCTRRGRRPAARSSSPCSARSARPPPPPMLRRSCVPRTATPS